MGAKLSRKPDDVLRRIGAGGTAVTVNRILAVWRQHTPADLESGARWYGEDATTLLQGLVAAGAPSLEHAASYVSHMSIRTSWQRNVSGAYAFVASGAKAARALGCMAANVSGAVRASESNDPLSTLNGPKTSRFARNLLGDREAVTVDVWAARVALGGAVDDPEGALSRAGVYDAVEHAYRLAARRVGVDPTTMQATTWIVARNGRAA